MAEVLSGRVIIIFPITSRSAAVMFSSTLCSIGTSKYEAKSVRSALVLSRDTTCLLVGILVLSSISFFATEAFVSALSFGPLDESFIMSRVSWVFMLLVSELQWTSKVYPVAELGAVAVTVADAIDPALWSPYFMPRI